MCFAGLFGALAVVAGAVGAHGLSGRISESHFNAYEVAVQYMLIHAVALLGCALGLQLKPGNRWLIAAAALYVLGIILFSGSLVVRSTMNWDSFAQFAPFGGMALIGAWMCVCVAGFSSSRR